MSRSESRRRTAVVAVRMMPAELRQLQTFAEAVNVTVPELIRRLVFPEAGDRR